MRLASNAIQDAILWAVWIAKLSLGTRVRIRPRDLCVRCSVGMVCWQRPRLVIIGVRWDAQSVVGWIRVIPVLGVLARYRSVGLSVEMESARTDKSAIMVGNQVA